MKMFLTQSFENMRDISLHLHNIIHVQSFNSKIVSNVHSKHVSRGFSESELERVMLSVINVWFPHCRLSGTIFHETKTLFGVIQSPHRDSSVQHLEPKKTGELWLCWFSIKATTGFVFSYSPRVKQIMWFMCVKVAYFQSVALKLELAKFEAILTAQKSKPNRLEDPDVGNISFLRFRPC